MTPAHSNRAFSLIELIVVIAIIAIVAGVLSWRIFGVLDASKNAVDTQNIKVWNTAYVNAVAAGYKLPNGTEFSTLDWNSRPPPNWWGGGGTLCLGW